jgi:hypothetical protein
MERWVVPQMEPVACFEWDMGPRDFAPHRGVVERVDRLGIVDASPGFYAAPSDSPGE